MKDFLEYHKEYLWSNFFQKSIWVGEHSYPTPKEVIIDRQQRLTSLYAVIKGKKVKNQKYEDKEIIISFKPLKCIFEVGFKMTKKDMQWIYNISDAYTLQIHSLL